MIALELLNEDKFVVYAIGQVTKDSAYLMDGRYSKRTGKYKLQTQKKCFSGVHCTSCKFNEKDVVCNNV